jgi:hypothetical protein
MTEQEIIKGLECCTKTGIPCVPCPYHTRHGDECVKDLNLDALALIHAKNAELKAKDEEIKAIKAERDEERAEVERLMQSTVTLPLRIGTTIIDKDEHGEYYMIQCATEQAAQRRMERGD